MVSQPNPAGTMGASSPIQFSKFSNDGRTQGYGTVYQPFGGYSNPREIIMTRPGPGSNPSPISMGPGAGL